MSPVEDEAIPFPSSSTEAVGVVDPAVPRLLLCVDDGAEVRRYRECLRFVVDEDVGGSDSTSASSRSPRLLIWFLNLREILDAGIF